DEFRGRGRVEAQSAEDGEDVVWERSFGDGSEHALFLLRKKFCQSGEHSRNRRVGSGAAFGNAAAHQSGAGGRTDGGDESVALEVGKELRAENGIEGRDGRRAEKKDGVGGSNVLIGPWADEIDGESAISNDGGDASA